MLDKVLQWMTAELKQEIRASKVNETREGRVFEEAIEWMTAELKQEIRASKVNQTGAPVSRILENAGCLMRRYNG